MNLHNSRSLQDTILFPSAGNLVPPHIAYEQKLKSIVHSGDRILDAGCGLGKYLSWQFAKAKGCQVTGVDLSDDLRRNPNVDNSATGDLTGLPFADASFDVIACRMVVEHLQDPEVAFRECHRVLKPGGRLAIFTPNLLHYFGAIASVTPEWFHRWFNSRVREFAEQDTFRTHYLANTPHGLRAKLKQAGFPEIEIRLLEGAPSVLEFNSALHQAGLFYMQIVNKVEWLSSFRLNILAIAHKAD